MDLVVLITGLVDEVEKVVKLPVDVPEHLRAQTDRQTHTHARTHAHMCPHKHMHTHAYTHKRG